MNSCAACCEAVWVQLWAAVAVACHPLAASCTRDWHSASAACSARRCWCCWEISSTYIVITHQYPLLSSSMHAGWDQVLARCRQAPSVIPWLVCLGVSLNCFKSNDQADRVSVHSCSPCVSGTSCHTFASVLSSCFLLVRAQAAGLDSMGAALTCTTCN